MINPRNNSVTSRRAFTLAELLVAIGATAILTVGIGRIVASINTIVVQGGALEEVQANARAIEQLMRKDFELLNQMNADETYIAIRSRELGTPERPIYRDEDDKRADRRANVVPYDIGSLAIYSRLDEIVFIAGGSDNTSFTSKQSNGFYTGSLATSPNTQASKARIYYGHGLKPKPFDPQATAGDPFAQWPDRDPTKRYPQNLNASRIPPRIPQPDGFFGDQPSTNDPSLTRLTSINRLFGRNEFANSWALARQPVLLDGSASFGSSEQRPTPSGPLGGAIIAREPGGRLISGKTQGVAPTLLDRESFSRWWLTRAITDFPDPWELGPGQGVSPKFDFWQMPVPRLLRHGATDVVAQTNIEFRDWIEGDAPPSPAGGWKQSIKGDSPNINNTTNKPLHGIAYQNGGWLSNTAPLSNQEYPLYGSSRTTFTNALLDQAQSPLWSWGPKSQNNTNPDLVRIKNNIKSMRTALAGSIVRPIVESQARLIDRVYEINNLDQDPGWHGFMDNHAVIAAHCSNFEVAWSDGSFAKREIDIDNDGISDYFPGDIIWFDITRVKKTDPNEPNSKRQTMNFYAQNFSNRDISWAQSGTDEPKLLDQFIQTDFRYERVNPEIDQPILPGTTTNFGLVGVETSIPTSPVRNLRYNPELTGGLPSGVVLRDGSNGVSIDMAEYLTIWPFRKVSIVQDDINAGKDPALSAWRKPSLVRIRLTLHDSGGVLKNGKEYEFIFNVNLRYP